MGRGIAHVFALYHYPVILIDKEAMILQGALEKIKERTPPELWDQVSSLIQPSTDLAKAGKCNLVIEAVFEEMGIKKELFKALNTICKREAIIATNTSSLSINKLGKAPAFARDSPGFISNRLLFALIGEAFRLLEGGVAAKEDIDTVMKSGMNHPMGPIELADFIGLDVCMQIMQTR